METFKAFVSKQPTWEYIGTQKDLRGKQYYIDLFNNIVPVGMYKEPGYTLSRQTVEKLGFKIPTNLKVGDKF